MLEEQLAASSRVALAAYLHDLGKFAERARITVDKQDLEWHKQEYCPRRQLGQGSNAYHYTHIHAAYTALAFSLIEPHLPELRAEDFAPFGGTLSPRIADSLVNAAARHHTPDSFLQWVIATADRVASGFEREAFDSYNQSDDITDTGLNHYQARQLSLLEGIRLAGNPLQTSADFKHRQPLVPLSPEGIFPQPRQQCEGNDNTKAQQEYAALWQQFLDQLSKIPRSHRQSLPLWLDHFDSAWQTFTHAIPSATVKGTRPDVSLYDHSHTAAALAVALWRYHHDLGHDQQLAASAMSRRADWDEQKLLLIQGDFFGVQNFIFAGSGSDTRKKAAKLLRGRSLYVSLMTECAALKVLDRLALPTTSQVTNAAGKFLIVAPNTPEVKTALVDIQRELNQWFLEHSFGQSGLGLAWFPAACNDFVNRQEGSGFSGLMKHLFQELDRAKHQRFHLCSANPASPVFDDYLTTVGEGGICDITGWGAATTQEGSMKVSPLAADQIRLGDLVASKRERLAITREPLKGEASSLRLPLFGYFLHLTTGEEESGKFGPQVATGNLRRLFDFSLPEDGNAPLWNGYARRAINGYVPVFSREDTFASGRYLKHKDFVEPEAGQPKLFDHLACEDRRAGSTDQQWIGIEGLGILKGDVDNLGAIFQKGLEFPTFAKMAALSRQINSFFSIYLPWLCKARYPNTYTVFAGGDDFFLIGPWHSLSALAAELRQAFSRYVAGNPELHFSAGIAITKSGLPVPQLSRLAEDALEHAKGREGKNGLHWMGQTLGWEQFHALSQACEALDQLQKDAQLTTGFIYSLLELTRMAGDSANPESARWRSLLNYRSWRHLEKLINTKKIAKERKLPLHQRTVLDIGENGIRKFGAAYQVAVTTHLYLNRD